MYQSHQEANPSQSLNEPNPCQSFKEPNPSTRSPFPYVFLTMFECIITETREAPNLKPETGLRFSRADMTDTVFFNNKPKLRNPKKQKGQIRARGHDGHGVLPK